MNSRTEMQISRNRYARKEKGKELHEKSESWMDTEYPASRKAAQNLIYNARRFKKEGWGRPSELENRDEIEVQQHTQVIGQQQWKSIEWATEMKIERNVRRAEDL